MNRFRATVPARRVLRSRAGLFLAAGAPLLAWAASAQEITAPATTVSAGPDLSAWVCRFCPFELGMSTALELGVDYVSDDSYKYGDFNGLDQAGAYLAGSADWRYRGEQGDFANIQLADPGLDSRSLFMDGGRQGSYRLFAGYRELPRRLKDSGVSPFVGAGGDSLSLPAGWTTAGTTSGMSDLSSSLRPVKLRHDRRQIDLGATLLTASNQEWQVRYRHEARTGLGRVGATFVANDSILPQPLDYDTEQLDLSAGYVRDKWQLLAAYYGSIFRNSNESLTWQNPYDALAPGADQGRLALAPDNQFHQVSLSSAAQPANFVQLTANVAAGRGLQNQTFVPATINPNLPTSLPRNSLDGQIDTLTGNVLARITATRRLRLSAEYRYNERDNRTPQDSYPQILTDVFTSVPRTNLAYGYLDRTYKYGMTYRFGQGLRLAAGIDRQTRDRSFQTVARTSENTVWGKVHARLWNRLDLSLRYADGSRSGSALEPVTAIQPPENPRMRAFQMADRRRRSAGAQLTWTPADAVSVSANADYAEDDYAHSVIGLSSDRNTQVSVDVAVTPAEYWRINGFASGNVIHSELSGSQGFAGPDWQAQNQDDLGTLGIGLERQRIFGRLDLKTQYIYSTSRGRVEVTNGASNPPFPDLKTQLQSLGLQGNLQLRPDWMLKLGYRFERYSLTDWQQDDVAPDTVSNVLSLGASDPSYRIHRITLLVGYNF